MQRKEANKVKLAHMWALLVGGHRANEQYPSGRPATCPLPLLLPQSKPPQERIPLIPTLKSQRRDQKSTQGPPGIAGRSGYLWGSARIGRCTQTARRPFTWSARIRFLPHAMDQCPPPSGQSGLLPFYPGPIRWILANSRARGQ